MLPWIYIHIQVVFLDISSFFTVVWSLFLLTIFLISLDSLTTWDFLDSSWLICVGTFYLFLIWKVLNISFRNSYNLQLEYGALGLRFTTNIEIQEFKRKVYSVFCLVTCNLSDALQRNTMGHDETKTHSFPFKCSSEARI